MAEAEEKQEVQNNQQNRGKFKLPPIVKFLGLPAILGVVIGGGLIFFASKNSPAGEDAKQSQTKPKKEEDTTVTFKLPSVIVNLRGTEARRYLKLGITLSLSSQEVQKKIEERTPEIIDRLILLLSDKTLSDLEGAADKEAIRREIKDELNDALGDPNAVLKVFFTDFVVQ